MISEFVAIDIRRDVEVVDVSEIESGIIRARVRTCNVLYAIKGITAPPDFGEVHPMKISELWKWPGEPRTST